MAKRVFVTGIGTDIGKTLACAILLEALKVNYWKPLQAGNLKNTDTHVIRSLISNNDSILYPETFLLSKPMSPFGAALEDKVEINSADIILPKNSGNLIIEGAGGLMVPLNKNYLVIDLIKDLEAEVVLVSKNYLGSINHTLLSVEALQSRNIPIKGIIYNGYLGDTSEKFIADYTGLKSLLQINKEEKIDKTTILKYATKLTFNPFD